MTDLYKDAEFYNSYFSRIENIVLSEPFQQKENLFVGQMDFTNTIHPLSIRVEIPVTFPHHKLKFWTSSLKGYPHLIYKNEKVGSWFCLNTPFAETAEEQLNQELSRLNEWIERQMRPDLKAIIEDNDVVRALRKANAYSWENLDEVNEYRKDAMLTFVGDDWEDASKFKENIGTFSCIRQGSNKLYIAHDIQNHDFKLPYVCVDEVPNNLNDFLMMQKQFKWDEEICKHLLPKITSDDIFYYGTRREFKKSYEKEEAIQKIQEAKEQLKYKVIPNKHQECIEKEFEKLEKELEETNRIKSDYECIFNSTADVNTKALEEEEERRFDEEEYYINHYPYEAHHFAFGVRLGTKIIWGLFSTQRHKFKYNETQYDLGVIELRTRELQEIPLFRQLSQHISENQFFGRGRLEKGLRDKKIGLLGAGALGSMLAESLIRGGVKHLHLWDNDLVEPGNICRSGYNMNDLGESKIEALSQKLRKISPFCKIKTSGGWSGNPYLRWEVKYTQGDFYSNINYSSQQKVLDSIKDCDLVIDCTGSNELLHFLSYALTDRDVVSCCITNRAKDLLCLTNRTGNLFEQRKMHLARIEQDTENFYVEGTGCWSPTFLANYCDIAALVNLFVRDLNDSMKENQIPHSKVWSYRTGGVVADKCLTYKLEDECGILLHINSETLLDAEEMENVADGCTGYLLGGYSNDGKHIYATHCILTENAEQQLTSVFTRSNGIIDYIGDYTYSFDLSDERRKQLTDMLADKASDTSINTNNPLLATRNTDGSIGFHLYINGNLVPFKPLND